MQSLLLHGSECVEVRVQHLEARAVCRFGMISDGGNNVARNLHLMSLCRRDDTVKLPLVIGDFQLGAVQGELVLNSSTGQRRLGRPPAHAI